MTTSAKAAETTAQALLEAGAFLVRPNDPFRLTSGLRAPFYINCRQILSHPAARATIADALAASVPVPATEVVAGGVTAGVPFATMVADRLSLPLVYVRTAPKGHGTASQIEGGAVAGREVVLIEDLITTAGSVLAFAEALRKADARVSAVRVVFSRAGEAAQDALAAAGLSLTALSDLETLLAAAQARGVLDDAGLAEVRAFLADPDAWSARHGG